MGKASEAILGDLHKQVAESLSDDMRNGETPQIIAAARAQAIAFLKNNNITADPGADAGLLDLKATLAAKRASRKESLNGLKQAGDDFEAVLRKDLMQ